MPILRFAPLWALTLVSVSGVAQYRLLPGNQDRDGLPTTPARICLGHSGTAHCFAPPDFQKNQPFGLDPRAVKVGALNGRDLTLFSAIFSGAGSRTLTSFALLTVGKGDLVNLLPKVWLSEQSEYKVWNLPEISKLPLLVTADFILDSQTENPPGNPDETHFSAHRYTVSAYAFDPAAKRYRQLLSYGTVKKYPGLDELNQIRVLELEQSTILSKLQSANRR